MDENRCDNTFQDTVYVIPDLVSDKIIKSDDCGLLWYLPSIRVLFKEFKMWPTFVGPRYIQHGTVRITTPVSLWPEQEQYITNTSSCGTSKSCSKRKLCDFTAETEENKRKHQVQNPTDITRALAFRDLHDRGYFLGPADVYGGDYSLYKGGGDPTQTHSVATVRVIDSGHKISARELLAFSRVQNQVAKSAVLAFRRPLHCECKDDTGSANSTVGPVAQGIAKCVGPSAAVLEDGIDQCNTIPSITNANKSSMENNGGIGYIVINFRNVSDR